MNALTRTTLTLALALTLVGTTGTPASAQLMAKPQVANLIKNVENGVDDFRNYLEKRGENTRDAAAAAGSSGAAAAAGSSGRRSRQATSTQKAQASTKKDALDDALGDLNKSTNRLRRTFDATDKWMETKSHVEHMLDDARKINPLVARGNYGTDAARLWTVLRSGINDLARAYGATPLAI